MNLGRNPACIIVPCRGAADNTSGKLDLTRQDDSQNSQCLQLKKQGNRCDHDKNRFKRPRFHEKAKKRPHSLEEAKRRIAASISDNFRYPMFAGLFYHKDEAGKPNGRHIRSERIEGIHGLALPTLLQTLNLHRMACGYYDSHNRFHHYNYAYIENQTEQSSIRVKREMRQLQEAGIIRVSTVKEKNNDGSWRTKSVQIEFTDKIFEMLELMDEFLKDRETIALKFHARQAQIDKKRKKKEIYRKQSFKPRHVDNRPALSCQSIARKLTIPSRGSNSGRGEEIRSAYNTLLSQGRSPQEAAEILRNKYPPPH